MTTKTYAKYTDMQFYGGLLDETQPFTGNSLDGISGRPHHLGRLNTEERTVFHADSHRIVYYLRSYNTPIAWVYEDGSVYVTAQKFSTTTSRHQTYARAWLNLTHRPYLSHGRKLED